MSLIQLEKPGTIHEHVPITLNLIGQLRGTALKQTDKLSKLCVNLN